MSWLFSQVLVEEYLGENFSDGEQSVPLSGSHIQQAYLSQDRMTKFSRLSRFGMTFVPLTESRGEELLTLYLADFHVKTLVQQEKAQELMENVAECGEKWQGSFAKWSQDSFSWKTHQCSLLGGLDKFSETWPQWGLMRDGECWEQQTLERTIKGIGYGLSPNGVDSFHTPNTAGLDGGSNSRKALKKKMEKFPTPRAQEPARTSEGYGRGLKELIEGKQQIKKFQTPISRMWKDNGQSPSELNRNSETLATQAGGSLNPTWVEWLMGWPLGWTDLKPLETDKCHCVQQQHGEF